MKSSVRGVVLLCLLVAPAWGQDLAGTPCATDAVCLALLDQAQHQSRAGALVESEKSYRLAYELSHDAKLLFNIARVLDKRGQAEDAKAYYRQFLESAIQDEAQKAKARELLAKLDVKQVPSGSSQIAPTPPTPHTPHTPHTPPTPPTTKTSAGLALKAGDLIVTLRDGSVVRGTPWEVVSGRHVLLRRPNETFLRIEWAEMNTEVASKIEATASSSPSMADRVRVSMVSNNPSAGLYQFIEPPGFPKYWANVCQAPCGKYLPRGEVYRIDGPDVKASNAFWLTGSRMTLDVKAISKARSMALQIGGISFISAGSLGLTMTSVPIVVYWGNVSKILEVSVPLVLISASSITLGSIMLVKSRSRAFSNGKKVEPAPEPMSPQNWGFTLWK